jgi:beta-glucanase (GH16 family)/glycerophosphoryl diester phosphodiesterase
MHLKFFLILGVTAFCSCRASKNIGVTDPVFADNVVVAHRGAFKKNNLPENSIASLKEAIRLKCTGSEFDVRMTADDSLVINHDPVFQGLEIEKQPYAALTKYKLGNGEKLPTLYEYLRAGLDGNQHTRLICEIKPSEISKERGKQIAVKVLQMITAMKAGSMVEYISFDYGILQQILAINKNAITHYLAGDKTPAELKQDGVRGADYHFSVFQKNPDWIQQAKQQQILLNAWTVNKVADMDWLIESKFDFITTNEPELLLQHTTKTVSGAAWKLSWSEEFNYTGLPDENKWSYETGGHGWGNNELQFYTAKDSTNAWVQNGVLRITAANKKVDKNDYTSARLVTKGKAEFSYGRIEVSAKLPAGRGLWPAIWMLPGDIKTSGWPAGGEIDIMEHVGYERDTVLGTVHTEAYNHVKNTQRGKKIFIESPYDKFHLFAIEWTKDYIDFFVDDKQYLRFNNENKTNAEWPFNKPFYLVLNIAVGGNLGGQKGVDRDAFPAAMEVDYVRVYQK